MRFELIPVLTLPAAKHSPYLLPSVHDDRHLPARQATCHISFDKMVSNKYRVQLLRKWKTKDHIYLHRDWVNGVVRPSLTIPGTTDHPYQIAIVHVTNEIMDKGVSISSFRDLISHGIPSALPTLAQLNTLKVMRTPRCLVAGKVHPSCR